MRPFRRRATPPSGSTDEDVTAFWQWWELEGRAAADAALAEGRGAQVPGLDEQLEALGAPSWELAPGLASAHLLLISGRGVPAGRAAARRLVRAAPSADDFWSYADFRPARPDPESVVLGPDGVEGQLPSDVGTDLARVTVSARVNGSVFDVQVHHPVFTALPAQGRELLAVQALHAALGELDTELWVGEVQPVEVSPLDGFGLTALRSVVEDLKRQHLDADGDPRWVMMRGKTPKGELRALVRSPLHPLTAPHLDTYVLATLPYPRAEAGLPSEETEKALQSWQDDLEHRLGDRGRVVAHLSHDGSRTVHLYLDSAGSQVATVREEARSWPHGKVSVHQLHDPDWQAIAHLRR